MVDVQIPTGGGSYLEEPGGPSACPGCDPIMLDGGRRPLVGRQRELHRLRHLLADPRGGALLLVGELGAGTSALLEEAAREAVTAGLTVARVEAVESEQGMSFAAANQLRGAVLDACGDRTGAVGGRIRRLDPIEVDSSRRETAMAMLALLRAAGERRRLLITIDGAEWLDPCSVAVISFLARRTAGSRVRMVMALTPTSSGGLQRGILPECEVGPLDDASSRRVLDRLPFTLAPQVRSRVLAESGGNPLALVELPAALSTPQRDGSEPLPDVLPLGEHLGPHVARSVATLPEATRELLLLVALSRQGLVPAPGADGAEQLEALAPAEEANVVAVGHDDGDITFRHPLMRAAVIGSVTAAARRRAHLVLAERLEHDPGQRAWHLGQAAHGPDERLGALLEAAARELRGRGDPVAAVDLLVRSVAVSLPGVARARRSAAAAHLQAGVIGDLRSASRILDDVRAEHAVGGSLAVATAVACVQLYDAGQATPTLRVLVDSLGSALDRADATPTVIRDAVQVMVETAVALGRPESRDALDRALVALERSGRGDLPAAARVEADPIGCSPESLTHLDDALARLADVPDPGEVVRVAGRGLFVDRLTDVRGDLQRAVRQGRRNGAEAAALKALHLLAFDSFATGEWDEAVASCAEGGRISAARRYELHSRLLRHVEGLVAAGRGEVDRAAAIADSLTRWAAPRRLEHLRSCAAHIRSIAALGWSDYDAAYREASSIAGAGELGRGAPAALWVPLDLVESAVRTDRHEHAAAHVEALRASGVERISPRLGMLVTAAAALVEDGDAADDLFERALATTGVDRWPFDFARVHLLFGEQLRRSRATTEARTHLALAETTFERLGARPWAARAGAELRAAGQRTVSGSVADLTPQELEVAMLAATGLSNKQIAARLLLSHRTVGAHLYRIFPKLGITSRAALRDALGTIDLRTVAPAAPLAS